jgi:hypothetical protein
MQSQSTIPNCVCQTCGKSFYKQPRELKRSKRHFCSRPCRHTFREPVEDRFWSKVDKPSPEECWLWLGSTDSHGYGSFGDKKGNQWHGFPAHRVAWELTNGPIPDGQIACHRCDNPPCVNPRHLFLGTDLDNVRDMDAKGRRVSARAEKVGSTKLTWDQVRAIRVEYRPWKVSMHKLAARYGVHHTVILDIIHNRTWRE